MNLEDMRYHYPELANKIHRVRNLKGRVRKISDEEAGVVRGLDEWRDGYFPYADGILIALSCRDDGQHVIYEI